MMQQKLKSWKIFVTGFFITVGLFSCKTNTPELKDKAGVLIQTENLYTNQTSGNDSLVNYSFYLPSGYNGKEALPVVFFVDPKGNGTQPLSNYKDLANKYGYILIGSNLIKNGLPATYTSALFEALLNEVRSRFLIDEKRLFTSGFSGGAKLAILFAQQYREIIGVAACGASLPLMSNHEPSYYYVGIVGDKDFNYLESYQTFSVFDQKGYDYTSVVFNGEHEWPPLASFEAAFTGFEIYSIKTERTTKNEAWLNKLWNQMQDSILAQEKRGDYFSQQQTLRQASRWFYGLKSIKELRQQEIRVQNQPNFIKLVNKKQRLIKKEVSLRTEFIRAIEQRDLDWWRSEVENIRKTITNEDLEVALVSERLLNYISMASYMLTKTDLDDGKLDEAYKKIQIYQMVDPENPDAYLMAARYFMLMEDAEAMHTNFDKAKTLGFTDFETYEKETSWRLLMETAEKNP
jgi:dienelactone hydrolase